MSSKDRMPHEDASGSEPDDPRLGRVVADRYELVARMGPGTLGIVYQARHVSLDRRVVLELLDAEQVDREAVRERFKDMMKQLARVRHPNVAELESFGVDPEGSLYVVTKHVDAPRLNELIEREHRIPWARGRGLVLQIAAAVDAAHKRSVMHGGLWPKACHVITKPPHAEQIVVTDFALGEIAAETRLASDANGATTRLAGDPRYLALEQFATGHGSVAADVYAIGAVLYHVLTGAPPHSGANAFHTLHQRRARALVPPRELEPSIPLEVEAVLLRTLAGEPQARPPSARELAAALEAIPANAKVVSPAPSRPTPTSVPAPARAVVPPPAIAPRADEEDDGPATHVMPPWKPSTPMEDDATTIMARQASFVGPSVVEATTMWGPASTPFETRPEGTTVLGANELRRVPAGLGGRGPVERVPVLLSTERLVVAPEPAPLTTAPLLPPAMLIASPGLSLSPNPTLASSAPHVPPLPPQASSRAPGLRPIAPVQSAATMQRPSSRTTWPLVLGVVLVMAAVGASIGLALVRASTTDRASPPKASLPEAAPEPRRTE